MENITKSFEETIVPKSVNFSLLQKSMSLLDCNTTFPGTQIALDIIRKILKDSNPETRKRCYGARNTLDMSLAYIHPRELSHREHGRNRVLNTLPCSCYMYYLTFDI